MLKLKLKPNCTVYKKSYWLYVFTISAHFLKGDNNSGVDYNGFCQWLEHGLELTEQINAMLSVNQSCDVYSQIVFKEIKDE